MKSLLIAGNWKSNKTISEAREWLQKFKVQREKSEVANISIIICVPFTLLYFLKDQISLLNLPLQLGVQDVSPFSDGAYTGEISARQIKELADWVIIGHSERRKYFGETDELLKNKVEEAKQTGLKIIYCVTDDLTAIPQNVDVVAYEPVWAIGTGKSDTPDNANKVISKIKANSQVQNVIYGGSVIPENVRQFCAEPFIDGVLPGGASLDAEKFNKLIVAASS